MKTREELDTRKRYVLRTCEERGVRLIRLWFTDVLGKLKSVAISPAELESAFDEGMTIDGSSIDGFRRVSESDVLLFPDAETFELLPWAAPDEASGRIFCDVVNHDGTPFEGDPRSILRRTLDHAHDRGYTFFTSPEVEFFYFKSDREPIPVDQASYFDLTTQDIASPLRKRTLHMLEALGIPVEYSFHEESPSQHELDLRYSETLDMADNIMTMRLVVKKIAAEDGLYATFMPKPIDGVQGSGMHTHMSLFKGDANAFHDPDDEYGLSDDARAFMAGLLFHAREFTAVTNQLVNSYKRLVLGAEAPVYLSWARNNRSALVRVPLTKPGKGSSTRLEYRAIDPSCNPYLAFAVLLAAGLKGIEEGYRLPDPANTDLSSLSGDEAKAMGLGSLPLSLGEALFELERSAFMRETLGDHVVEWILRNKHAEWAEYTQHVTQFEIDRYLPNW